MFHLFRELKQKTVVQDIENIEKIRAHITSDQRTISNASVGAVSTIKHSKKLSSIAKRGISDQIRSLTLSSLITYTQSKTVLELGTSIGINTLYLAKTSGVEKVVTVDANTALMQIAKVNFSSVRMDDIEMHAMDVGIFLDNAIAENAIFDFIFVDANHTKEATLNYFEQCLKVASKEAVIVFDDINWSKPMREAWCEIRNRCENQLIVENDQFGIVFSSSYPAQGVYVLDF